jgi:hypothetical protein
MMLLVLEPTLLSQLAGGGGVGDFLEGTGILLDVIRGRRSRSGQFQNQGS